MTARVRSLVAASEERITFPGVSALTEDSLALQFVADFGNDYRYAPGWGWMRWDGTRWMRDVGLQHYDDARKIAREFGDSDGVTPTESRRIANARTVGAIVQLARADRKLVVMPDAFDADAGVLNTPTGTVNLRTGEARPHRRDLVTRCTAVAPATAIAAPVWERFLDTLFGHDVEVIAFMRRLIGYFATGEVSEQVLAFFFGDGRNGKSTLLDLLLWILGDYALKSPASLLMAQRGGDRHPTDIASLAGARLAVSNEIEEGAFWDESRLKELTGDTRLTGRFMRMDFFVFNATHKHVIAGNHRPQVRSMDAALRRRLLLIPFAAKFEGERRDPDMLAKLKVEAGAILAWIVGGAREWYECGLQVPAHIRQASEDYAIAMDSLGMWLDECCDVADPEVTEASGTLYASYATWKSARGEHPVSATRWSEQMQTRGFKHFRSNGSRFRAVRLTAEQRYKVETWGK